MALLQIAEPGQSAVPHERKLAVGIDLGTTNSLVASVRSGKAETLADQHGSHLVPSVVRYLDDAKTVGEEAMVAASSESGQHHSVSQAPVGKKLAGHPADLSRFAL